MNIPMLASRKRLVIVGVSLLLLLTSIGAVQAQNPACTQVVANFGTFTSCRGTLADGSPYGFQVPTGWNGTAVLFSEGYSQPGTPIQLFNIGPLPRLWLLRNGYAVAVSNSRGGWDVRDALHNQIETLDSLTSLFGSPARTIAFGGSLGGMITAGLVQQHPERFTGALSLSGVLGGAVGAWNQGLDMAFVIQQLLGPESGLQIVNITDPGTRTSGNLALGIQLLDAAQATAEGRARIAFAAAVLDVPGWFDPLSPEPAADDYVAQESNQFLWIREVVADLMFGWGRSELEGRAGGNPSWNTDVNYGRQLENSVDHDEVLGLYATAGLSLEDDLARLAAAPRIAADPAAVEYLKQGIVFNGDLGGVPVLTVHTTGDGLVNSQHQFAYRSAVLKAQDSQLLRQVFVYRGGHVTITSAETIAAFYALLHRIDTGKWEDSVSPESLNAAAQALGPVYNVLLLANGSLVPMPPAYQAYDPAPFLRPYDLAVKPPVGLPQIWPVEGDNAAALAARPLRAWPLPYQGGSLQVSMAPGASVGANVDVAIYDLSGRRVRMLARAGGGGSLSLRWDGRNDRGVAVCNGIYFLRATGAGGSAQLKLTVIR